MTTNNAYELAKPFIDKAEQDADPYMVIHFSREEDFYKGWHEGMDIGDALLVIKHLVNHFKIDKELLAVM